MNLTPQQRVHYVLRIAVAMCFIGHGAFGIITKAVWCNYFGVFGIGPELSYQLMPVVGIVDILLGVLVIVYPMRAIPAWLVLWGIFTAMLRPLSGEPFPEFIERAGNYGVPFCLLLLEGFPAIRRPLFSKLNPSILTDERTNQRLKMGLQVVVFLLFMGHGWLNLIEKAALLKQYQALGFTDPSQVAKIIGIAEIIGAFAVLVRPIRSLLVILFLWKVGSELFYPNYAFFEWVERGGSFGAILALWIITKHQTTPAHNRQNDYSASGSLIKGIKESF